jgi:homogentisate 1,2-dioxygenase
MGEVPTILPRYPVKDIQKAFHYTDLQSLHPTRKNDPFTYTQGWGNRHYSEVIPGALPVAQNNPQQPRFGLYTEGITHSAFATPRTHNMSTYMYRVRPSAAHKGISKLEQPPDIENCFLSCNPAVETLVEQAEWAPFPLPKKSEKIDFIDGLHTLSGSGDPNLRQGLALYVYMFNSTMQKRAFCNADGDFLIAVQLGTIVIQTELGMLHLEPGEICVIQRGIRFSVSLTDGAEEARGYVTEVWGSVWELPDLGPLGGHGLANPRDFLFPTAHIDEELGHDWTIISKTNGKLSMMEQDHSPFDVVAWHGNVVPYKVTIPHYIFGKQLTLA